MMILLKMRIKKIKRKLRRQTLMLGSWSKNKRNRKLKKAMRKNPTKQTKRKLIPSLNPKTFQCKWCSKVFTQQHNLKQHETLHTGDFKYKCEHCGLFFSRDNQLKAHMFKHTGVKPYHCVLCGKGFSYSNQLSRHKRAMHWHHWFDKFAL